MQDRQLSRDEKELLADVGAENGLFDALIDLARNRIFKEFEKAMPLERMHIGAKLDALGDVRHVLQKVINEVSESGRISRIN